MKAMQTNAEPLGYIARGSVLLQSQLADLDGVTAYQSWTCPGKSTFEPTIRLRRAYVENIPIDTRKPAYNSGRYMCLRLQTAQEVGCRMRPASRLAFVTRSPGSLK